MEDEYAKQIIFVTRSGRRIDLMLPSPADITIDDIAWSLAGQSRFYGHTSRNYTIAEHCILGLELLEHPFRFEFLMHDATEAYLGDVYGPLKELPGMQFYRDLEAIWAGAIAERFGLRRSMSRHVYWADKKMLMTELRDLMGRMPLSTDAYTPFPFHIEVNEPTREQICERFMDAFRKLVPCTEGAIR